MVKTESGSKLERIRAHNEAVDRKMRGGAQKDFVQKNMLSQKKALEVIAGLLDQGNLISKIEMDFYNTGTEAGVVVTACSTHPIDEPQSQV